MSLIGFQISFVLTNRLVGLRGLKQAKTAGRWRFEPVGGAEDSAGSITISKWKGSNGVRIMQGTWLGLKVSGVRSIKHVTMDDKGTK